MKKFNRAQIVESLRGFYRIDGAYDLSVEESIGLTTPLIASLDDTPFIRFSVPVGGQADKAAVAAANSFVYVTPGSSSILDIRHVTLTNKSAAAKTYRLTLLSAVHIASLTKAIYGQMADLSSGNIAQNGFDRPSAMYSGSNAGIVGRRLPDIQLAANVTWEFEPPSTIATLYGSDGTGLAVWDITLNEALDSVFFYGREWAPGLQSQ